MLQQQHRLRRMKDFDILFKEGKFVGGKLLTLKIWKIDPEKYPRREYSTDDLKIGVVVGVKVSKGAVKRNRLKRQMREVVRLLTKEDKIAHGYMMALVAKPAMFGCAYEEIEQDVVNVLQRAGVLVV